MASRSGSDSKQKNPKSGEAVGGGITLDECQLNEQTAKNKHKQTSALAMADTPIRPAHPHAYIYLYEYVRAARKCSHTRMGSHILISFNLAHIQCRTVTRLVIGIVCLNACPLSGNGHGCHPHPSFHHGHRKCGMDTS